MSQGEDVMRSGGPPRSRTDAPSSRCTTKLDPIRLSQQWKVENIMCAIKLCQPASCLRSQVFKSPRFPEANWQLCLYPGGKREENKDNVSLFLKMSAQPPGREICTRSEYRFFFLDDNDHPKFSNVNIGDFHAKPPKGGHSWGLRNIPRQKIQNSIRSDGSLLILCEIEILPDVNRMKPEDERITAVPTSSLNLVPEAFLQGQSSLFLDSPFSDYSVEVEGRSIPVHKAMLSAHSEIFRAMLSHSAVTESSEQRLVIEEFKYDAVYTFLCYLYSGRISPKEVEEWADQLLALSDKYGVPHLKALSEDHLVQNLDSGSVCQLLALADMHGAQTLRGACIKLLRLKKDEIISSDSWSELKSRNPRLSTDALEDLMCRPPPAKRSRSSKSSNCQSSPIAID